MLFRKPEEEKSQSNKQTNIPTTSIIKKQTSLNFLPKNKKTPSIFSTSKQTTQQNDDRLTNKQQQQQKSNSKIGIGNYSFIDRFIRSINIKLNTNDVICSGGKKTLNE